MVWNSSPQPSRLLRMSLTSEKSLRGTELCSEPQGQLLEQQVSLTHWGSAATRHAGTHAQFFCTLNTARYAAPACTAFEGQ